MKSATLAVLCVLISLSKPLPAQINLADFDTIQVTMSGGRSGTVNGLDVGILMKDSTGSRELEFSASNDRVLIQHRWKKALPRTVLVLGVGSFRNTPWVHGSVTLNMGGCLSLTQWSGISSGKIGENEWSPQSFMHLTNISCRTSEAFAVQYTGLRVQDGPRRHFVGLNLTGKTGSRTTLMVSPEYEIEPRLPLLRVALRHRL